MRTEVWQQNVVIPTYGVGEPEPCPVFLERRVYQGSSGAVYPYPVIEKVLDEKRDQSYQALFLENHYLKIMILPELGGRVQMAYDKLGQRHFIYYNRVIKPALVGLLGPWVSGGIEFNWPQHHRPSTFFAIDWDIRRNGDGSASVLVNEIERMTGTKALTRFTLFADKAYLEVSAQLFNRTPQPCTFLWWANPAVKANDHYESIFPPDVTAVFDHGKRDVSTFPIATGTYYKVDYSSGVDIARYKNLPVPTSYMAAGSRYDFLGGYEHDTQAGMLHVADHQVSPGKKQWTWGHGDFGRAWDRNLTDEDGPYIELMCGVFTDNQPDFSWLAPCEEKRFDQYFLPYRDLGRVHNASRDALLHFEVSPGNAEASSQASIKLFVTSVLRDCWLRLTRRQPTTDDVVYEERLDLCPERSVTRVLPLDGEHAAEHYHVSLTDSRGRVLVSYSPQPPQEVPLPKPAEAAPEPKRTASVEQLYLTGLHLEQYRHATRCAADFYREGLRREASDVRCNNALGRWLLKRGRIAEAKERFQVAIATLTQKNPNPYDGEPFFNLGVAHQLLGELELAYDAFYKASWNAAHFSAAHLHLAQVASARGDTPRALKHTEQSLLGSGCNHLAHALHSCLLRLSGRTEAALRACEHALELDPFNFMALYEKYQLTGEAADLNQFERLTRRQTQNLVECSLDYARAGLYREANAVLAHDQCEEPSAIVGYLQGWYHLGVAPGDAQLRAASQAFARARRFSSDFCFPSRLEEMLALQAALTLFPDDSIAHYCLGNFLYAAERPEEAIDHWQSAIDCDPSQAIAHRNLAIAHYNKRHAPESALRLLQRAFELHPAPRLLMELDQLKQRMNIPAAERLAHLQRHQALAGERDDVTTCDIALKNRLGRHQEALAILRSRKFHPWEGGEGKVTGEWVYAHLMLAQRHYFTGKLDQALRHLTEARNYPQNLGEGKLPTIVESELLYWLGRVHERLSQREEAERCFREGTQGTQDLGAASYYNDQPPEASFYQAACLYKLGRQEAACARYRAMLEYGRQHMNDEVQVDYFAVSLPDLSVFEENLASSHQLHCHYLMGLGALGLGNPGAARSSFEHALALDCCHAGATRHLRLVSGGAALDLDDASQYAAQ